jgi:hypothetical protein
MGKVRLMVSSYQCALQYLSPSSNMLFHRGGDGERACCYITTLGCQNTDSHLVGLNVTDLHEIWYEDRATRGDSNFMIVHLLNTVTNKRAWHFITVFTRARQWRLSWARRIQFPKINNTTKAAVQNCKVGATLNVDSEILCSNRSLKNTQLIKFFVKSKITTWWFSKFCTI